MLQRRQEICPYSWSPQNVSKRVGTAPRPEKFESIHLPSRVTTSSSKYNKLPPSIHLKDTWKNHNPREPVRTISSLHTEILKCKQQGPKLSSPRETMADAFEHVWEEGSKRPKTQNEKCRRKNTAQEFLSETLDIFPSKTVHQNPNMLYEVPIIVQKNEPTRRIMSAKEKTGPAMPSRPHTFKPGKSVLITSLDQEFLKLFQN